MNEHFAFAKATRRNIATLVNSLTIEELNKIPDGCNNNIAWHLGHIVVSSELLCYIRTEAKLNQEIPLQEKYRNDTKPENFIQQTEIDYLLSRLQSSLEAIEADYNKGMFQTIKPYATHTFGIEINTIEMVFQACSHHDVLHAGCMGIMRKYL